MSAPRWFARMFLWCECISPEGWRCVYRRHHSGLHKPAMGHGYEWGDWPDTRRAASSLAGKDSQ